MDAPFESLEPNIQARLKSIEKSVNTVSAIEKSLGTATLLQKFYIGIANTKIGRLFIERSIKDAEQFAIDFFTRGDDWIDDATKILYGEGMETAREAIAAQLSSAFGKAMPDDFILSQTQKRMIWERARDSAESIAQTYNQQIPGWIKDIKERWIIEHGSLRGLNRWNIISRMGGYHRDFQQWKEPQIAITEFSHTWAIAMDDFWTTNEEGLELEFLLSPSSASSPEVDSEPLCSLYAGQYLSREEIGWFPAHIQCIHFCSESRIKSGTIPPFIRIGNFGYSLESLPIAEG